MIGLVTQSEGKVRNVTSPSHQVESKEVLDSGEKHNLANTVQLKSTEFQFLLTVRLEG